MFRWLTSTKKQGSFHRFNPRSDARDGIASRVLFIDTHRLHSREKHELLAVRHDPVVECVAEVGGEREKRAVDRLRNDLQVLRPVPERSKRVQHVLGALDATDVRTADFLRTPLVALGFAPLKVLLHFGMAQRDGRRRRRRVRRGRFRQDDGGRQTARRPWSR